MMSIVQKVPDYFRSEKECKETKYPNSNPRYPHFRQTNFTVGDEEQFQRYRHSLVHSNGQVCIPEIPHKLFQLPSQIDWEKYSQLSPSSVNNTFHYLFHKFKKGIFVKIQENALCVFLPFSKANFINEWGDKMRHDPKRFKSMTEFLIYTSKLQGYTVDPRNVNAFPSTWYANNCLVRTEYPVGEGDSGVPNIRDMLIELCKNRKIPDIEFFVNRRDFPIIKLDGTEPYEHIFGNNTPLLSHNYKKYSPILSMVTTNENGDIPIPTYEDWARISSKENKFFDPCRNYNYIFDTPFSKKRPTAVFRGASTGCGTTIEDNPRLKLAHLSGITPPDTDGIPLLDAGITKWNLRPRKEKGKIYLSTIEISKLPIKLTTFMSPEEQSKYKYIINVDGHVSAYRLSLELGMGSVVLLVDSPYKLWYSARIQHPKDASKPYGPSIQPYVHYVPVKRDLSDLLEKIKWCKEHEEECEKIANNAKIFSDTYLGKEGIFDYLQALLIELKKRNGIYLYNYKTPFQFQMERERQKISELLLREIPEDNEPFSKIVYLPYYRRAYGLYKGIEWILRKVQASIQFVPGLKMESVMIKGKEIAKTRTTTVQEYSFSGYPLFAVKNSSVPKIDENFHEVFVGLTCINQLLQKIPNFIYTFGEYSTGVVLEQIKGETFDTYINGYSQYKFNLAEYFWILSQICLALHVAQQECGLIHYDLYPWNIILQRVPTDVKFDYVIKLGKVFRIATNVIPIIIDYGKSHVIYENFHYGLVELYKVSSVHDILSILLSSLNQVITKHKLVGKEIDDVLRLANFISNTQYRKESFKNLRELKEFLQTHKKYAEMLESNKYELEKKGPLDLFDHISKIIGSKISIVEKVEFVPFNGNPKQVYDFLQSDTIEKQMRSFIDVFVRFKQCTIPRSNNQLFSHYIAQTFYSNLYEVYTSMNQYITEKKVDVKPYREILPNILDIEKLLRRVYTNRKNIPISVKDTNYFDNLESAKYSPNTFQELDKLADLLLVEPLQSEYYVNERKILLDTIMNGRYFPTSGEINVRGLVEQDGLNYQTGLANEFTLYKTSLRVIGNDYEQLVKRLETETGECEDALEYLKKYEKILFQIG